MKDLSFAVAEHAATFNPDAVSTPVMQHLSMDLVDSLGVAIAGANAPGVAGARRVIAAMAGSGPSRVVTQKESWPAPFAAMANATAGHALDYDDTLDDGGGMHAGAPVHAAALAVADSLGGVTGRQYVSAVAVGLDVAVRLALAPTQDFGWHRTSAFGIFGVTVAAGRLLGLDAEQMRNALGIAYSHASGNRQCIADGSLSKRLQAGFAAFDGITAAYLAREGLTGASNVFEGVDGFFNLYQRGQFDRNVVLDGIGGELRSTQISLKPYPCGRNLHAILDAALEIRGQVGDEPIADVAIALNRRALDRQRTGFPSHVVEAQFSARFAVAGALVLGTTPITLFARPDEASPAITELFEHTQLVEAATEDDDGRVSVTLATGRRVSVRVDVVRGSPQRPLTPAEVRAKFMDCLSTGPGSLDRERAVGAMESAFDLSSLANTSVLTDSLAVR